jgi:hypothetical protein
MKKILILLFVYMSLNICLMAQDGGSNSLNSAFVEYDYSPKIIVSLDTLFINANELLGVTNLKVGQTYSFHFNLANELTKQAVIVDLVTSCSCIIVPWNNIPLNVGDVRDMEMKITPGIEGLISTQSNIIFSSPNLSLILANKVIKLTYSSFY